jgi:thiol-disulfide isomerase/thioredoxin
MEVPAMKKGWIVFLVLGLAVALAAGPAAAADEKKPAAPAAAPAGAAPAAEAPKPPPPPPPPKYDEVGAPLPSMSMKYLDGSKSVQLDNLGAPSMFMFVNSSCSACRMEMGTFVSMAKKLQGKMDVYVVSVDFDPKTAFSRMTTPEMNEAYKLLDGSDFKVANALGFNFTPATVIVDKSGKQVFRKGGYVSGDEQGIAQAVLKLVK